MTIKNRAHSIKRTLCSLLLPLAAVTMLSACERTEAVYNVNADPAPATTAHKLSTKQVGDVIAKVAAEKGWTVSQAKPGLLHCSIKWVNHVANIDITYSRHDYSIALGSTVNLNEANGQIHRNYNQRIQELQAEIDRQLSQAASN